MGAVERAVIEAAVKAVQAGAAYVSEAELDSVARDASNGGKAGAYAVTRLNRRGLLGSVWDSNGTVRLGYKPTLKAYKEMDARGTC